MATKKKDSENTYITENGLEIKIKKVPPMILSRVMKQIKVPERPMYESQPTITGRTQMLPLTEEIAEQVEHGKEIWEYYEENLVNAQAEQNELVTQACFAYGTEAEIPEDGWSDLQEQLGIEVPPKEKPIARKAHYLMTELSAGDIAGLMTAVMKNMSLPEELVAEAEDSFRRAVRNGSNGTEPVEESEPGT